MSSALVTHYGTTFFKGISSECVTISYLSFRQILFNLLSNAIKFTQNHGSIWVSVNNDPDNQDLVIVEVKDTGIHWDA